MPFLPPNQQCQSTEGKSVIQRRIKCNHNERLADVPVVTRRQICQVSISHVRGAFSDNVRNRKQKRKRFSRILSRTSCCSTDSEKRPHRCCHLLVPKKARLTPDIPHTSQPASRCPQNTYIHTDLYSSENRENESEASYRNLHILFLAHDSYVQDHTNGKHLRNALFDALRQLPGTHYRKLFSVVTLLQFLSLG